MNRKKSAALAAAAACLGLAMLTMARGEADAAEPAPLAEDAMYALTASARAEGAGQGAARFRIQAKPGYSIKKDTPLRVTLTPPAGTTLPKTKLGWDEATLTDGKTVELSAAYVKTAPAPAKLDAALRFVLCDDKGCYMKSVQAKVDLP